MAERTSGAAAGAPPLAVECEYCGGDGWYVDHEDECYEQGDCNCSGVQRECEGCLGRGTEALAEPHTERKEGTQ